MIVFSFALKKRYRQIVILGIRICIIFYTCCFFDTIRPPWPINSLLVVPMNIIYIKEIYNQRLMSAILYIPMYPFVAAVAISFVGTCVVVLIDFIETVFKMVKQ